MQVEDLARSIQAENAPMTHKQLSKAVYELGNVSIHTAILLSQCGLFSCVHFKLYGEKNPMKTDMHTGMMG